MTIRRFSRWAACAVIPVLLAECHTRSQVVAVNPALTLSPTCTNAVSVFADRDHVPYDYYEVALITAEGNAAYNGNGDVLKAMRAKAALAGANGVIVDALGTSHATVKVIGAVLGTSHADRKGRAVAIWMPSDTARVREACGR
ncbi:MAG: hypothetical protein ACRENK_13700 [Gemmatimonadaceae bacterium]